MILRLVAPFLVLLAAPAFSQDILGKWRSQVHIGSSGYEFKKGDSVCFNVTDDLLRYSLFGKYSTNGNKINISFFPLTDIRELPALNDGMLTLEFIDQSTGKPTDVKDIKIVYHTDSSKIVMSENKRLVIPLQKVKEIELAHFWIKETNHYKIFPYNYYSDHLQVRVNFLGLQAARVDKIPDRDLVILNDEILQIDCGKDYCTKYYRGGYREPVIAVRDNELDLHAHTYGNTYLLFKKIAYTMHVPIDTFSTDKDSISIEGYKLPLEPGENTFYIKTLIPENSILNRFRFFTVETRKGEVRIISKKTDPVLQFNRETHLYVFKDDKLVYQSYGDSFDPGILKEEVYILVYGNDYIKLDRTSFKKNKNN
jgi:hypothetical protein